MAETALPLLISAVTVPPLMLARRTLFQTPKRSRWRERVSDGNFRKGHAGEWTGVVKLVNSMLALHSTHRKNRARRQRGRARKRLPMDEKLRRAFQLAYFILGDEQAALRATEEAVATLDIALAAQDKRFYYAPGSRAARFLSNASLLAPKALASRCRIPGQSGPRRSRTVAGGTAPAGDEDKAILLNPQVSRKPSCT